MESFKLQTEKRTALYFNKYTYRAKCNVRGAGYTYFTSSLEEFKEKMERRARNGYAVSVMLNDWRVAVDEIDYEQLKKYYEWRDNTDDDLYLARIQGNQISFFSNDLELLKTLSALDPKVRFSKTELQTDNILYFKKEPKHKFRTFFRGKKSPENFKADLETFVQSYGHLVSISPALIRALEDPKKYYHIKYMHSSYYIDYDTESTQSILNLFFSSMLGKTYSLAKQP
jgi:hypothetical protein